MYKEMKTIDLNDWTLFSARKNSDNYISRDGKWLLKASSKERKFDIEEMKREQATTENALAMGIVTPRVGEIVQMPDGNAGLIYEYIEGKKSYSRMLSETPEKAEEYMKKFAAEARKFHSTKADKDRLPPFEQIIEGSLNNSDIYSEQEKYTILNKIERLPKAETCLHGDMQFSNIIEAAGKSYFIDLELMSYGHPYYDLGFLWFVVDKSTEELSKRVFHADIKTFYSWWKMYAQAYFDSDDIEAIEHEIKPYGYISANIMLKPMPDSGFIWYNKEEILASCRK